MNLSSEDKVIKIALIGSRPPPIGGTSVSFEHLVSFLACRKDVAAEVVDTSGVRGVGIKLLWRIPCLLFSLVKAVARADVVSLHICTSALPSFGLLVLCLSRLFRKPLVLRKFGGTDYLAGGYRARRLSHFIVRHADLYLAQTRQLVMTARNNGVSHVKWYPTSRPMPDGSVAAGRKGSLSCRRFVYLGQVRRAKGVFEIIEAGERFAQEEGVAVDIYGPLDFDVAIESFPGLGTVRYRGVVSPQDVGRMLESYDALLLPSYHPGEGYPGVVLEAYAVGLPVICTRWRALPEIVDERTGILVEPNDAESLYLAMKRLTEDDELYARLRKGVAEKRSYFSSEYWGRYFIHLCHCAVKKAFDSGVFPVEWKDVN